ncbi:hypothetical protein SI859A1_03159 [Aurantimonas manganoxydans SI85-9A1]|uniref:Uncharacterized protein n=1 Tax=Aurantimonas manganoxydans (strain ATCC BAA-1229 / DSM 21871 / SI85-9A1) TaxID=287752 RepID=Q1YFM1_AURMS|nr:hypothetical protein SI859A1_03159 [Aurantimonas manganoxydans SI85-9A1]
MKAKMPRSASFQKSPRLRRPGTPKGRIRCAIIKSSKMTEKSLLIGAALPDRPTPRHGRRPARASVLPLLSRQVQMVAAESDGAQETTVRKPNVLNSPAIKSAKLTNRP